MKTSRILSFILLITAVSFFYSCNPEEEVPVQEQSILPERFAIDVPGSLSHSAITNGRTSAVDTLKGNLIYYHLGTFIHVGDEAASIVQDIIAAIWWHHINKPMSLSFEGDEDGRQKNLVVKENAMYDGKTWEFELTITDAASEGEPDGGKGFQLFWNRRPIQGIALIKPSNINKNDQEGWKESIFRIEYSEAGEYGYEANMIVSAVDLPVADPLENPYSLDALKMFVGKDGRIVDVYGNSNHPNATFFAGEAGYNWAFVASGDDQEDIGVAEVGLPSSNLDEPGRDALLNDYAIKEVLSREIYQVWPWIDPVSVEAFLYNADAPGYFDNHGFIQGGMAPAPEFESLAARLDGMSPYNPKEIRDLEILFK